MIMAAVSPLFDLMGSYTILDYDNNDAELCKAWPAGTFTDMTSNQAIVFAELQKHHHSHLLLESVKEASKLALSDFEGVKGRDVASIAIDIVTIKLGLRILPFLKPTGLLHCQLSLAHSTSLPKLLSHAHSIISLYSHYSVPVTRVCLKIPSTVAGLEACAVLEKEGINTLATMCFSVEQALAGGHAGARYVATYVNPLDVHFVEGRWKELGLHELNGYEVMRTAQRSYNQRGQKTSMMAASIVSLTEGISLAGLAHSTLSPAVLSLLTSTALTPEIEEQIKQSIEYYASGEPSKLNCDLSTEEGRKNVENALQRPDVKELMSSATEIFGDFEIQLFGMAKKKLEAVAEGH